MSYILEALNKSEQERRNQQTPDLNTRHRLPPSKTSHPALWVLVLTLLMIIAINAIGLWVWLRQPSGAPAISSPSTEAVIGIKSAAAKPSQVFDKLGSKETIIHIDSEPNLSQTSAKSLAQSLNIPEPAVVKQPLLHITQLPPNVQGQIPELSFSSHFFSEIAELRMVNINGRTIHEGDTVAASLQLKAITEEGVILSYLHHVFEVSVLQDWSAKEPLNKSPNMR